MTGPDDSQRRSEASIRASLHRSRDRLRHPYSGRSEPVETFSVRDGADDAEAYDRL